MDLIEPRGYEDVIHEVCNLRWSKLSQQDLVYAAWAYYYFSIQFRENLEFACSIHPDDEMLRHLREEECNTSNLSPYLGVAEAGEKMNHDEFMRRSLQLSPITESKQSELEEVGEAYLREIRAMSPAVRAASIASYEDGGLERVFNAILQAVHWNTPLLQAFRHFLVEHIRFDSDPEQGHGALSRHLAPNNDIAPLWAAFRNLFLKAVPNLEHSRALHKSERVDPVAGVA